LLKGRTARHYNFTASLDQELPQAVEPVFQHGRHHLRQRGEIVKEFP
jgi:hypothetical protein